MDKCVACGLYCQHAIIPPFTDKELQSLDPTLAEPIIRHRHHKVNPDVPINEQTGTRVCSWFYNGRCIHYNIRPQECRDFEVDGEKCIELVHLSIGNNHANTSTDRSLR